jgi:hypothetical protein
MAPVRPETLRAAEILVGDYLSIKRNDAVVITADDASDPETVGAVLAAAVKVGARPAVLSIPQLPFQGSLADPYLTDVFCAAVKNSDAWIDLCFPYVAGSRAHDEAMKAKRTKYLLGGDIRAEGLIRMFGRADLDLLHKVQLAFDDVVAGAVDKTWRVTSRAGTDVSFRLDNKLKKRPRRAEKPGSYGVPGSAVLYTDIESVRGRIVIEAVFHEKFAFLPSPITLTVDGKIREVSGEGADMAVLDRSLRRAGGGEYGYVIHFTHGFNPGARANEPSLSEATRTKGNNSIGLGRPFWVPGGGENHPDGIVSKQSMWAGGEQIIADGNLVAPGALAELAARLVTPA